MVCTYLANKFDFDDDDAMQKKWKAFVCKIDTKTDDYGTVLKAIKEFLTEPFYAVVKNSEYAKQWFAQNSLWQQYHF